MVRLVRTQLTPDMKNLVDAACKSLKEQSASAQEYKQAAKELAGKFVSTSSSKSAKDMTLKSILEYMIAEHGVSKSILSAGTIDENGIEVVDSEATLPKELAARKYGCFIDFKNCTYPDEAIDYLLDSEDFIMVTAYKLKEHGVLYPSKYTFFAHPSADCSEWAREIVEDYGCSVSKSFRIVWEDYYNIEIETARAEKQIRYNKMK